MAFTVYCDSDEKITLDEYIDHLEVQVDFRDVASILESAPKLCALTNDRELVVQRLHAQIKQSFSGFSLPSSHVIFLGRGTKFYVRANIWPSTHDVAQEHAYQDQVGYHQAHDHNYNFMTVNYLGQGYRTEIFEYDNKKVKGRPGEAVDFSYLETVDFKPGMVMLYRASTDMHVQRPPEELSISLNLMIPDQDARYRDQYFFNLSDQTIMEYPPYSDGSLRTSILEIASYAGNNETLGLLDDVARSHPCRRTRLSAFEAMNRISPENAYAIWEVACRDREPLVAEAGRHHIAAIDTFQTGGNVE